MPFQSDATNRKCNKCLAHTETETFGAVCVRRGVCTYRARALLFLLSYVKTVTNQNLGLICTERVRTRHRGLLFILINVKGQRKLSVLYLALLSVRARSHPGGNESENYERKNDKHPKIIFVFASLFCRCGWTLNGFVHRY